MKFKIEFSVDNAAFADDKNMETACILREIADKVEDNGASSGTIRDINGNTIGRYGYHRS